MIIYLYLIIMTIIGSFAAYFLKKATRSRNKKSLLTNINLYIGGSLYFITAIINIYILRYLPYSVVLPLTSITYIWTLIIAGVLLKEKISRNKIIGVMLIVIGAISLALSN
jgi:drug/metabolite transporter (DMT)-like permease